MHLEVTDCTGRGQHCPPTSQVLRFWLLSALLERLPGQQEAAAASGSAAAWRPALGRLAWASHELAPASTSEGAAARIGAELAPQLRALGSQGTLPQLQGREPNFVMHVYVVTAARIDAELAPQLRALGSKGTLPQLQGLELLPMALSGCQSLSPSKKGDRDGRRAGTAAADAWRQGRGAAAPKLGG